MSIGARIRLYERDIEHHIRELVKIRSVIDTPQPDMPYGNGVDRALRYMLELGEQLGFTPTRVGGYAGHLEWGQGDELAAVLVHLDTVPEGNGWSVNPFGAELRGRRIYGRGAADNKGPAVVALFALKAIADAGIAPKRTFRIILGTNEENGMSDLDVYFARERLPDYAFVPDAAYPIIHSEKAYYVVRLRFAGSSRSSASSPFRLLSAEGGTAPNVVPDLCEARLQPMGSADELLAFLKRKASAYPRIRLERREDGQIAAIAQGKSGHGSYPPSGVNAIAHLAEFLTAARRENPNDEGLDFLQFLHERIGFEAFGESLGIAGDDGADGRVTVNLAQLRMRGHEAEAVLNIRIPPTLDDTAMIERLRLSLLSAGITLEVADYLPPLYVPSDHPLIRMLGRAYESVTGEATELLAIGGGTYARKLQNRGVAFGPGFRGGTNNNVHQPDEFVDLDDMMRHGEICTQAIYELIRSAPNTRESKR